MSDNNWQNERNSTPHGGEDEELPDYEKYTDHPEYRQPPFGQETNGKSVHEHHPQSPVPGQDVAHAHISTTSSDKAWPIISSALGLIILISAFLPWATLSMGYYSDSVMGMEGDGLITLFLGGGILVLGAIYMMVRNNKAKDALLITCAILGLLTTIIALMDTLNISDISTESSRVGVGITVGVGMILTLVGGVGATMFPIYYLVQLMRTRPH